MKRVAVPVLPAGVVAVNWTPTVKVTCVVFTVKVAEDEPAGIVTVTGWLTNSGRLDVNVTTSPPVGAGLESVMVPVELTPPRTEVGLSTSD